MGNGNRSITMKHYLTIAAEALVAFAILFGGAWLIGAASLIGG